MAARLRRRFMLHEPRGHQAAALDKTQAQDALFRITHDQRVTRDAPYSQSGAIALGAMAKPHHATAKGLIATGADVRAGCPEIGSFSPGASISTPPLGAGLPVQCIGAKGWPSARRSVTGTRRMARPWGLSPRPGWGGGARAISHPRRRDARSWRCSSGRPACWTGRPPLGRPWHRVGR